MFKRGMLSVRRRKVKTIIFFAFLFIVSSLVLSSIAIKNATKESMENAKKSISSEVVLSYDMSKLKEDFQNERNMGEPKEKNDDEKREMLKDMHGKMNENVAKLSDVITISKIKYVSDVRYTVKVNGTNSSFSIYEENNNQNENDDFRRDNRMKFNNNSLEIEGINTFDLESDYVNKKIELIDGESFDETSDDTVVISYELSVTNNLNVNDTITITNSNGENIDLKIIGIYQYSDSKGFNTNYNKIYVNINTAEKFMTEEEYNNKDYQVSDVIFYLNDSDKVDEFISLAKEKVITLEERNLTLDIDTMEYKKMVSNLEGVLKFSNIVLIVVSVSSIVIISLMVINSLKDRNYEIGVLLSFGEKKMKIIGQFIIELVLIATGAFILSIGSSKLMSQKLANIVMENQQNTIEVINNDRNIRGTSFGPMNNYKNENKIKSIDVSTNIDNVLKLFLIGYGIIVISMIIPSIKILNTDPKNILSRKE